MVLKEIGTVNWMRMSELSMGRLNERCRPYPSNRRGADTETYKLRGWKRTLAAWRRSGSEDGRSNLQRAIFAKNSQSLSGKARGRCALNIDEGKTAGYHTAGQQCYNHDTQRASSAIRCILTITQSAYGLLTACKIHSHSAPKSWDGF